MQSILKHKIINHNTFFMSKVHEYLSTKFSWYANWHNNVGHGPLHFLFLALIATFIGSHLYTNITVLAGEEAFIYAAGMTENSSLVIPHLFIGQPSQHEPRKFGIKAQLSDADTSRIEKGTSKLQVKLPEGRTIVINLRNLERRGLGNVTWRGTVEGQADSGVTISLKNGFLAGTIRTSTDLYEILPSEGKKHAVEKVDPTAFPAESDPIEIIVSSDTLSATSTSNSTVGSDGVVQIDLLSVYTAQARAAAGGVAQIDTLIQAAVDNANTAFINSQINAHYNLVATQEVVYTESGYTGTDLPWVQSSPVVAALRDQYAADMVSMIVQNGGSACGTGYLMGSPSSSFASQAFQVTDMDCAVGNLTFAHEHGHNLGMHHDPANGSGAYYNWSYGHFVNGVFRTVMTYPAACSSGCPRVPYFSNPNVAYAGYPAGIPDQRDNARTANVTTPIISGFRGALPPATLPAAPSALTLASLSSSQIRLAWADNSFDELGFKVERSQDGVNFVQVGATGANVASYTDTSLTSSTLYYYRVTAYNTAGDSTSSNISSATTGAPDTVPPVVSITGNGVSNKTMYGIAVTAKDNVAVKSIQILINGVLKKTCTIKTATATPPVCSVSVKLNTVTNGSVITAIARDSSDNISQVTGVIAK